MSEIDLSQISDMALIDEINGRNNGLCVWTLNAREQAISVINALAGRDPAKLEGLLEAVKAKTHSLRCLVASDSEYGEEALGYIQAIQDALAAFEGREDTDA